MVITGGCFCGQVRYEVSAPLRNARCCHCSRCRKVFSGAGSAYAEVEPGTFKWASGSHELSIFHSMPDWGICFCQKCGSTLCGIHGKDVHGVTLGTVDGDPGVEIEMHIFTGSRAPWDHIGGSAPQYLEFPPSV
jgi:hypothetical protein